MKREICNNLWVPKDMELGKQANLSKSKGRHWPAVFKENHETALSH
jgi:hypothetical protein